MFVNLLKIELPTFPSSKEPSLKDFGPVFVCVEAKSISPPPPGVAHIPSPLQNVVAEAPVPLPKLPTGRLPVTPVPRGKPVAFVNIPDEGVANGPPAKSNVAFASGNVNVFSAVVGPANLVNPLPVPPKPEEIILVTSAEPLDEPP